MDEARMGRGNVAEEERLLEAVMRDDEIPEVRRCSPQTTTKIINRIRAMCMRLLEIEVDTDDLRSPTSRCAQSLQYSSAASLRPAVLSCCRLRELTHRTA